MNKDADLIAEAYSRILEKKASNKKPDKDGDGIPDYAEKKSGKDDNASENKKGKLTQAENRERFKKMVAGKKKTKTKVEEELANAYQSILEASATDKVINKKLARDYYKAVKAMRKCEHGSKDYTKFKSQKEDIMTLVKDHGKTIADLDAFLTKKEKEEAVAPAEGTEMAEESHEPCEYAAKGCKCSDCKDCEENGNREKQTMNMSDASTDTW